MADNNKGLTDAKPTRHLKEDKGVHSIMEGMRSPRSEKTNLKKLLYGPGDGYTAAQVGKDIKAGRVTDVPKTPRKKDASRLSASGYMSGPDWEPGSKKPE